METNTLKQHTLAGTCALLCLILSGCDVSPDNTDKHMTEALAIPSVEASNTELPDLALLNKHQIYPSDTKEEQYSPAEEVPSLITDVPLTFEEQLSMAALARTMHSVRYDGSYLKIDYPMGDVPPEIGVCTDVVIRAYRELGIDLQKNVHEDISRNFSHYPSRKRWGLRKPDANIDHRRVYNLQAFFERNGQSLEITQDAKNYKPGDLVTWQLTSKMPHIGVVLEMTSDEDPNRHLIAHNIGNGPVIEDMLFDFEISGHYRYQPKLELQQTKAQITLPSGQS